MGLDRFSNFISKSINNECIEEIMLNNNIRKIVANHIIFDLNFLIYQDIIDIENEVNDIIKIILSLPFITNNIELLEDHFKVIFSQNHWKPYYHLFDNIFDGFNEDEIIKNFILCITTTFTNSEISLIELVIYEKIFESLKNIINNCHQVSFINQISLFFDGIPSISKIIEQRRRRMKNYLESIEKKRLFKEYFNDLNINNKNLYDCLSKNYNFNRSGEIIFDYFKWIKNRFNINKSIGPSSLFIIKLEKNLIEKMRNYYNKSEIIINGVDENGESDFKIFKSIAINNMNGDYCIHTTDSDFIHQILIQQTFYKIINKDINLTVAKHTKNINGTEYVQILDANIIIKNMLDHYIEINNFKTNNYKIIWDLCFIFYLFGNDHLPSSVEIGPELGLDFFMIKHYQSLNTHNIINLKKNNIIISLNNLNKYLKKINESKQNNITKIILQRFFKINNQLINTFVDKLNLNFNDLQLFLKKFIIYKGLQLNKEIYDELDEDDLRKKYISNEENIELYKNINIFGLDGYKNKILMDSIQLIEDNIDYNEIEYNGLILYNKTLNIKMDSYQDLYNYIVDKSNIILNKREPLLYDYIDIRYHLDMIGKIDNNNSDVNDYLKKIYHLTISQFGNMKDFHTDNLTFYKYYNVPSLNNIINYLSNMEDENDVIKIWNENITEDNYDKSKYLNSINHYLLISPFIQINKIPKEILNIINEIGKIDNLFMDENFNYRNIDINNFLKLWSNTSQKINLNIKNNELINIDLDFV